MFAGNLYDSRDLDNVKTIRIIDVAAAKLVDTGSTDLAAVYAEAKTADNDFDTNEPDSTHVVILQLPPGVFALAEGMELDTPYLHIQGAGQGATRISGEVDLATAVLKKTAANIEVSDLEIYADGAHAAFDETTGSVAERCLNNCRLNSASGACLLGLLSRAENCTMLGNQITTGAGAGIVKNSVCISSASGSEDGALVGLTGTTFLDCYIKSTLAAVYSPDSAIFRNCHIESADHAIVGGTSNVLINCRVKAGASHRAWSIPDTGNVIIGGHWTGQHIFYLDGANVSIDVGGAPVFAGTTATFAVAAAEVLTLNGVGRICPRVAAAPELRAEITYDSTAHKLETKENATDKTVTTS